MNDIVKKEAQVLEVPDDQMVSMIERMAMNPDVDVDKFERLMAMQEKMLDRQAEQEYTRAMVRVQNQVAAITRDKVNPQTHSRFVSLEAMKKVVVPVYTKEGFALSFGEGKTDKEGMVRVTCKVMHSAGHSEDFFYDCPIDDKGIQGKVNKTATHGKASGVSYGERYITKLIFNLTIQDEDDDGNAAGEGVCISLNQAADLEALAEEVGANKEGFLKHIQCESFETIPLAIHKKAINALEAKRPKS